MEGPIHSPVAPETIEGMRPAEVDQLLRRLDPGISPESPLVYIAPAGIVRMAVVGDSHGDWRSTKAALAWFLESPKDRAFLGLGDYVDRAPADSPGGSAVNALYLLSVKASYPDRVFLCQGNHEAARQMPVFPHSLPEEMADLWGEDRRRYSALMGLLERGPLAGYTASGVFLAHGGFPSRLTSPWTERFRSVDETLMVDLLWQDAAASKLDRGLSVPFDEAALEEFFAISGLRVFLRGHDPDLVGRPLYHNRCLTLHTSRAYRRNGGILAAHVPMDRPVKSLNDIEVIHLQPEEGPAKATDSRRTHAPPSGARLPSEPSGTRRADSR